MMQKQQKQPLKFVIHSKLEQLGGEQSAVVEENEIKSSVIAEDSPESSNASTAVPDKSIDNDKKRKRNERDAIPMATKKVSREVYREISSVGC
jgi:flagella basal body P-ring formation protein FlgA